MSVKEALLDVRRLGKTLNGEWLWREQSLLVNPGDRWFLVATIMFMIAVAVQISSLLLIAILFFRFTHTSHRLNLERITNFNAISA